MGVFDRVCWGFGVAVGRGSGGVKGRRVLVKDGKWGAGARGGARGACLAASLRAVRGDIFLCCCLFLV